MELNRAGRPADGRGSQRRRFGADLAKDLAVAVALVVCAVLLRGGEMSAMTVASDAVLDAMSDDTLLDEHLGKLSFVSSIFPETALVFGEQPEAVLTLSGSVVRHGWREDEPYLAWQAGKGAYASPVSGSVADIRRDPDGTWSVVVDRMGDDACCVFGGLASLTVCEGDAVAAGAPLGEPAGDGLLTMEIRREGRSVWPDDWVRVTQ